MTFLLFAAGGVLVVAAFHLVAGWMVSNALLRRVFLVHPPPKDLTVRVREVGPDRIVLESSLARQDIGHPGTIGLAWDGGYAQVGEVVDVVRARVTRRILALRGTPPVCTGPLEGCPPVELDPYAFPSDPGDVGLAFEETSYRSPLGEMGAWLVPAGSGDRWAIHCHGWTAERREFLRMLPAFHRSGVTSMVIDYRNDPGRPIDPSGRYRFGLAEWEDLEGAVRTALDQGATDLTLSGCSTGGALVMAFLERSELAEEVSRLVLDAPNIVLAETVRLGTREERATPLMVELGMWIADLRWRVDWESTDYVQRASHFLTIPALVFHGTSDHVVPIAVSRRLEALVPDLVELVETQAAGHVMSWNADPARYEARVEAFLRRS